MFAGFIELEGSLFALYQALNDSNVPTAATGSPAYRIYSSAGLMTSGTGTMSAWDSSNVTGVYSLTHSITAASGYARGVFYTIRVQATVSGTTKSALITFGVV